MAGSNSGTVGQQSATDGNSEVNRSAFLTHQMLGRVGTVKLVRIEKVHPGQNNAPGTIDVTPLVNQVDGQGKSTEHGTVYGIQYVRWQGGTAGIICDPVVGDIGYAFCPDRDTSAALKKKGRANPGSNRRFDVADAVYMGTVVSAAPKQFIKFTPGTNQDGSGGSLEIADGNGNVLTMDSNGYTLATKNGTGTVATQGNMTATKNVVAGQGGTDQVALQSHQHQNGGGVGNSGAPVAGT
jgi:hypothetical protein